MTSARVLLSAAVLLGAVSILRGQGESVGAGETAAVTKSAEVARLLAKLGPADARAAAFLRLLAIGRDVGPELTAAIRVADPGETPERFEQLLMLAEELGPAATGVIDVLWDKADRAEGRWQWRTLCCIESVVPFLGEKGLDPMADLSGRFRAGMNDADADMADRARDAEAYYRALRLGRSGQAVHAGRTPAVLIAYVDVPRRLPIHGEIREVAAVLLAFSSERSSSETVKGVALLHGILRESCRRSWMVKGSVRFEVGPKDHRRVAGALLRLEPEPAIKHAAHCYLLAHGRRHQRWRAIEELRQAQVVVPGYEPALRNIVERESAERDLRLECVTSLGMLPELGSRSLARLREWAKAEDAELAARARAALRGAEGGR